MRPCSAAGNGGVQLAWCISEAAEVAALFLGHSCGCHVCSQPWATHSTPHLNVVASKFFPRFHASMHFTLGYPRLTERELEDFSLQPLGMWVSWQGWLAALSYIEHRLLGQSAMRPAGHSRAGIVLCFAMELPLYCAIASCWRRFRSLQGKLHEWKSPDGNNSLSLGLPAVSSSVTWYRKVG